MNDFDLINRKETLEAKPECLDSSVERITEKWTLADRSYARGWNTCIALWTRRIEELPPAYPEWNGWVHIDDIYRLISGHSNYHGDNILAALTCLAEGKEVLKPIMVLNTQSERKTGKWIDNTYCSECGWVNQVESGFVGPVKGFNFCPNCGSDNKGE